MYVVFLNNKLISCDTILPLMLELHARTPDRRVKFYCFDQQTFDAIKKNVVLWDGIHAIGQLKLFRRLEKTRVANFISRLAALRTLLRLAVTGLFNKVVFFHFKHLNKWPYRLLYLVNRRRTYLCQGDATGPASRQWIVGEIIKPRSHDIGAPAATALVGFHPSWRLLEQPEAQGIPYIYFGPTRSRQHWLDHVAAVAPKYFDTAFEAAEISSRDDIVVYILGSFGIPQAFRHPGVLAELFEEALEELNAICGDLPVFLKPHAITEMSVVDRVLSRISNRNFVVTHLHPAFLATRAKFFIANYYSTTFYDATVASVPTIEYTDYADATLEAVNGGSIRPEFVTHFINHDREALRATITELLKAPRPPRPEGARRDEGGLLARLAQ